MQLNVACAFSSGVPRLLGYGCISSCRGAEIQDLAVPALFCPTGQKNTSSNRSTIPGELHRPGRTEIPAGLRPSRAGSGTRFNSSLMRNSSTCLFLWTKSVPSLPLHRFVAVCFLTKNGYKWTVEKLQNLIESKILQ